MAKNTNCISTSISLSIDEYAKIAKKAERLHISKSALMRSLSFPKLEKLEGGGKNEEQ